MGSRSRSRTSGPVLPVSSAFNRSASPQPLAAPPSSYAFASSSASSFTTSSRFSSHRSSSPTRVHLVSSPQPSLSVRFSLDRGPSSPRGSLSVASAPSQVATKKPRPAAAGERRTCMCSPTTHPGSFRCSLHKGFPGGGAVSSSSNHLNARRSAMTNSLVRIGTVEGDWVKRALKALIRPSSHQQRRRAGFHPRPSRLSKMSTATDGDNSV